MGEVYQAYDTVKDYTKSAAATSVTSCEFAESVRAAYGRSGPPSPISRVISVYSTVTGE